MCWPKSGVAGVELSGLGVSGSSMVWVLPWPGITCLFKDLYKEIRRRNPKKVGYSGLR